MGRGKEIAGTFKGVIQGMIAKMGKEWRENIQRMRGSEKKVRSICWRSSRWGEDKKTRGC